MPVTNIFSHIPRPRTRTIVLAVVIMFSGGCSSDGVKDSLQTGFSTVGDKVSGGIKSIKDGRSKQSGKKSKFGTSASDIALVSKFPLDQVPHTLMRKPVAEGTLTSGHGYRLSPTGIPLPRNTKVLTMVQIPELLYTPLAVAQLKNSTSAVALEKPSPFIIKMASLHSMHIWILSQRD